MYKVVYMIGDKKYQKTFNDKIDACMFFCELRYEKLNYTRIAVFYEEQKLVKRVVYLSESELENQAKEQSSDEQEYDDCYCNYSSDEKKYLVDGVSMTQQQIFDRFMQIQPDYIITVNHVQKKREELPEDYQLPF